MVVNAINEKELCATPRSFVFINGFRGLLEMKLSKPHPLINPIHRDLALVVLAGLFASVVIVTLGYVIVANL